MSTKPTDEELEQRVRELEASKTLREQSSLHRLIESIQAGIVVHGSDGAVTKSNTTAQIMLGLTDEQILGKQLTDPAWTFLRKDGSHMPVDEYPVSQVLKTKSPIYNLIIGVKRNDKDEPRWFFDSAIPEFDENGQVSQVITTFMDISVLKKTEKVLKESEEKYRNLFENIMHEVHLWKLIRDEYGSIKTWQLIEANPAALKAWNRKRSEVLGKTPDEIFSYDTTEIFMPIVEKIFTTNTAHTWETYYPATDQYLYMTSVPFGEYFISTGFDITERKNSEMLLEKKNTDLKLAQRIASIGLWTLDPEVGVPEWSEEIYRIYERDPNLGPYTLEEYKNIYQGKWWKKFSSAIHGAITDGTPYDIELSLEFSSGEKKWIHTICEPESEIGPKGHKVRGTIQDITEKKETEEKLRQSQKMESLGTLAGGIAHEFNNMLGVIIGNTELALDDIPEWNPAAHCIQEIRTASLRSKDIVRKLLSFARKTLEARKPIQIRTIIDESLGLLRKTIPANIEIKSNLACTTETILGDPTEISQVLINLCTNSAHAMVNGKGVLKVTLETKTLNSRSSERFENISPGDYVKLTVSDNGIGISADIIDRIFEPYFTTKDVDEGLGMGLAVVYGIIKKHEGEIKIESEVRKGTTVEVLFPLIDEQPILSGMETETLTTGTERILLIDDEASLVKMITKMLTRSGYEVVGKTSSADALKLFIESPGRFDLVITDMAMPEITGEELAKQVIQVRPDIPIILCTGHSDRMDENRATELGIKSFAMKPLGKADLINTVRNVLDEAKSGS
ncbi:ATP-binding protein [Desulfopila sp. IMCC35008]|uniref:hybrid sensor histidine kinase/response regulator n=1 Tax=Desulfopila sp. IMCC35008 TaxID=2653858 RepID=UPI0013D6EA08|nr:ATP-binding protein [Desulfopila sp. IMCC35008]